MNFDFPDELKEMRAQARRFLSDRCPPAATRRVIEHGDAPFDRGLWEQMAGMGWMGAAIPEEHGGGGLGHLALCVLAEELGRAIATVPFASSVYLATEAIMAFGSPAQQAKWLPRLASGELIGTFAHAEQPGIANPERLNGTAVDGKLSAVKRAVPDGEAADIAVVSVNGKGGPWLYIVDHAGPGVTRERVETFDPSRPHATLTFAAAPAEPLAGADSAEQVRRLLDRGAIMMAFEQLGGAEAALEMARDYARQRYAFGRPIGSFQAIKHKLAEVYIAIELARSNAYYGAWALHTDAAELPIAASVARIAACDAGWLATKENIQTHGGMGFTWEYDCHLYYRRARLLGLALGSAREWKHRLVDTLKSRNVSEMASE